MPDPPCVPGSSPIPGPENEDSRRKSSCFWKNVKTPGASCHVSGKKCVLQSPRCATVSGFSVHANVSIDGRDRLRLERLARYVSRPAVSTERLSELPDGRLLYRLKRRWRNGTTEVVFDRSDFIAKLAALVPAPRRAPSDVPRNSRSRRQMASSDRSHTGRAIRRMRPRSRPAGIQPTPGKRTGRDGVRASAAKKKLFMVRASETGVRN